MFARVNSFGIHGLEGFLVTAEADLSGGLPQFAIVGLPDSAVKEAADRVRSASKNLGFGWPAGRITVNLAPAHRKKAGPVYDLPILLGILAAIGHGVGCPLLVQLIVKELVVELGKGMVDHQSLTHSSTLTSGASDHSFSRL